MSWRARLGVALLVAIAAATVAAPLLAPNAPNVQFADRQYAPPTVIRIRDDAGFRAPFIYRQVLEDRLERRYRDDHSHPVPLRWFQRGRLISLPDGEGPLLLFGADPAGRDIFSRLILGARWSLGVAFAGALGALAIGALVGGIAGTVGGRLETLLMLAADAVLVLPGAYVVLMLRGVLPPVLSRWQLFGVLVAFFAAAAWPHVARGVRAIVAAERSRDYAEAARAAGAGTRQLLRHFLPAARGFLLVEAVLLIPALLLAEVTVSYLSLGFVDPHPSWGTLLQEAGTVTVLREAPWILAPAGAIFLVVLAVQLASGGSRRRPGILTPSPAS